MRIYSGFGDDSSGVSCDTDADCSNGEVCSQNVCVGNLVSTDPSTGTVTSSGGSSLLFVGGGLVGLAWLMGSSGSGGSRKSRKKSRKHRSEQK